MSLFFLCLMPSTCLLLQALSRNLIYVLVGAACILAAVSVLLSKTKVRWWSLIITLGANTMMMLCSIQQHVAFGGTILDYLLSSIIIATAMLIAIIEAITVKK